MVPLCIEKEVKPRVFIIQLGAHWSYVVEVDVLPIVEDTCWVPILSCTKCPCSALFLASSDRTLTWESLVTDTFNSFLKNIYNFLSSLSSPKISNGI